MLTTPYSFAIGLISRDIQEEFLVITAHDRPLSLAQLVESRIRASTHGRICNLKVEEVQGRVVAQGQVPSHHTRQLALQGALELLSGDRFLAEITVG